MSKNNFQDDHDYADFVTPAFDCYEDDEVPPSKMPDIDDIKKEHDVDTYDQYVGAHVRVHIVLRCKRELDGTVRGRENANPMLDARNYEIEFPDGRTDAYTPDVISENMYSQCDIEGRKFNLIESIIDHRTDYHAVAPSEMYIKHGSIKKVRKTTIGWHLCVEWKDGTTSWERLADFKESSPVEVAEYVATKSLLNIPAFIWWAPHVLQKHCRCDQALPQADPQVWN
jgi:hypothetical protein